MSVLGIIAALYVLWLCGKRTVAIWLTDPIDLIAFGILGTWALGTLAALFLLVQSTGLIGL